ncbi:hypothetical protein [Clostridium perfringens]|uniref:hypothetical protein n=1 Tax=Clostridium perfringens TaxID=1502 RepID=UPI00189B1832|nr:hypothetical protein [Clostridium perfringens]HBI6962459.1 hypothetical protein [Clostridium perfringens]
MSKEQMYRKKFYEIVSYLKECSEAHIKNKQGIEKEVGVSTDSERWNLIMYSLDENLIKFYIDNKVVLSFGEDSPIISMIEGLILSINEE